MSESRLGAVRIDGLTVPQTASTRLSAAKNAIAPRAENEPRRNPATSAPKGVRMIPMLRVTLATRPISRSGVTAKRYDARTVSVTGITSIWGSRLTTST